MSNVNFTQMRRRKKRRPDQFSSPRKLPPLIESEGIHIEPPNLILDNSESLINNMRFSIGTEELLIIGLVLILLLEGCTDMLLIFALIYIFIS